ncbi:MAG: hypothetical protein PWQ15_1547 [Methanobacterium sp.]|jgi:hypothetical protein|nr:hypothetical protein [Methanobacterium sp.]CDG64703.1 hypothetical protein MBMB1_0596 [Methanobacterium sp. MB1]
MKIILIFIPRPIRGKVNISYPVKPIINMEMKTYLRLFYAPIGRY